MESQQPKEWAAFYTRRKEPCAKPSGTAKATPPPRPAPPCPILGLVTTVHTNLISDEIMPPLFPHKKRFQRHVENRG